MVRTTREQRQQRRMERKVQNANGGDASTRQAANALTCGGIDKKVASKLISNEDAMLNFVTKVNRLYQEVLRMPAPFITFVFCGMQSTGKSTIMERFMMAVLNIVQEGTGTRCPLDTTCLHDDSCAEPQCTLSGNELAPAASGEGLALLDVFERITHHNKMLAQEDRFSTEPLVLVYRSRHVQNMRFVDTPGIIAAQGQGKDNREDIKRILRSEMQRPNTKLCVLLEPKDFETNSIIAFCDDTFRAREKWVGDAICLMNKFDKQVDDARSGSKANAFFKTYRDNGIIPHLVMTPTLAKEDLPKDELFAARNKLLQGAEMYESQRFNDWLDGHQQFLAEHPTDEALREDIVERIGFATAKGVMRDILLQDTARRLPEVLGDMRLQLMRLEEEEAMLNERARLNDPKEVKTLVGQVLNALEKRVVSYLDGNLAAADKFPERCQTLEDEIAEEEESDWCSRPLNHFTTTEEDWRNLIHEFDGKYPEGIQADKAFLGGKQVQRAVEMFRAVLIDALPDPGELRENVANGTGYLGGGLQHENWERATVEVIRVSMKKVSHPGINFLIKHIGAIFRRLFAIALDDVKHGEAISCSVQLLPRQVERYLCDEFDAGLWELMLTAADKMHCSLEPLYSTVNPNLPTFPPSVAEGATERDEQEVGIMERAKSRFLAMTSFQLADAKNHMKKEQTTLSNERRAFLPEERTTMVTEMEIDVILRRSFEYIVALHEIMLFILQAQINHFLYLGFKDQLGRASIDIITKTDFDTLVEHDKEVEEQLATVRAKVAALRDWQRDVKHLQRQF